MRISKPELIREDGKQIYQVQVAALRESKKLWYSVDEKFFDLMTDSADAALLALLMPAMVKGEDIYVDGEISERLFYSVSTRLQKVLQLIVPSLQQINVYPRSVTSDHCNGSGVATGFSGGVDSFCVLADHFYSSATKGFTLTHLLFNNVGSHGWGGEKLFNDRYKELEPLAQKIGLPFIQVNSNVDAFYSGTESLRFPQTHTIRNASVALLLQRGIRYYMYASAFPYENLFIGKAAYMGFSDAITLPLFSTESVEAFSVGSEYNRVGKTVRISTISDSFDSLNVCVESTLAGKNCSKCWKCLRTLLTQDIGGFILNYSASFNLDIYKRHKGRFVRDVLQSEDPLMKEIVGFAEQQHYDLKQYVDDSLIEVETSSNGLWGDLAGELATHIPAHAKVILVDEDQVRAEIPFLQNAIPFKEFEGQYWGPPTDDNEAIAETERLRKQNASFLVIALPAFWWLGYYKKWNQYLRSNFSCIVENERLLLFDLKKELAGPA